MKSARSALPGLGPVVEPMIEVNAKTLFEFSCATEMAGLANARRISSTGQAFTAWVDHFEAGTDCAFLRLPPGGGSSIRFVVEGAYTLSKPAAGGWLLLAADATLPHYWLPREPIARTLDAQGHILTEAAAELDDMRLNSDGLSVALAIPAEHCLDAIIWRLDDAALIKELQTLAPVETQGYFLLGSHTRYGKPADLYRHLIHGWVYEDRYAWPHKRRICSENDAHALHLIFNGLERATGKRIYRLLKTQLLLSVLSRQSGDGGFRHGEWTEGMESHYRLHCSAMHLLLDALSEADDPVVRAALARGMHFISGKRDNTAVGAWFYHDELETSEAGMRRAPFKWWPGNALGKSPQNMLVLNTQLDTLVALDRYRALTGDTQYAPLVESGYAAAHTVLSLRPMEWLYRLVFSAIDLTLLPTEQASRLPLWQRLWKRIGWQVFVPRLPRLKTRYPRLVMPGGYIDRELSLQTWAYDYLAVNLMDLVRAAQGTRRAAFMPYIQGILGHCARTGTARRWLEHKGRTYAIGFYAEALYLLSLRASRPEVDAMLADALMLCMRQRLGLPPSLAGGNAEAQAASHRVPQPAHAGIVVANLSRADRAACIIVNAGQQAIKLEDALCAVPDGWHIPATELAPGAWLRIET
jgi:hypothetical protein